MGGHKVLCLLRPKIPIIIFILFYLQVDDLRLAECGNKRDTSVLDALKNDLECGWGAAPSMQVQVALVSGALICVVLNWIN